MKNLKNQKGITLVALIVTIIILLILAGVSLSLVAGGDGILNRASTAVDKTNVAAIKEKIQLEFADQLSAYYEAKYVNNNLSDSEKDIVSYLRAHVTSVDGYTVAVAETKTTDATNGDYYAVTVSKTGTDNITGKMSENGGLTWDQ